MRKNIRVAGITSFLSLFIGYAAAVLPGATPAIPPEFEILTTASSARDAVVLSDGAAIVVDAADYPVVRLAAGLFADDVARVAGKRPPVAEQMAGAKQLVVVGTLGHSGLIDKLAASGKLKDLDKIRGKWEATLWQMVEKPAKGIDRALVVVGSDRRGAAYGLMLLSEKIGVSPWYWWADLPARTNSVLAIKVGSPQVDAPAVKYRGIFINDEDWGLFQWASKTYDPVFGNIGPKTYEKIYELMLRLRLNYLWPAMHACSAEFGLVPGNPELADKFGIVAGASHCEPMLCNNVHWDEKAKGPWNYSLNRDTLNAYWEEMVRARGAEEAVWTLGIRGIHDQGMEEPPTALPEKINLVNQVITFQRELLARHVTRQWGPVAQCFVPYKEVLPIYDAGLNVPEDVTLVWVDDNFGYIRRLSAPAERERKGGSGVYWHLSYYGGPHSYLWINTAPPALMWEELHKAWENDARTLWIINVGDIKPMEIGVDFFSHFAWAPEGFGAKCQPGFLRNFAAENFEPKLAEPILTLLNEFYRLGTIRKPELMIRAWALSLTDVRAVELENDYRRLLDLDKAAASSVAPGKRDAYEEMIGIPARILADSGLIFIADRKMQRGGDPTAGQAEINSLRAEIDAQDENFNTKLAGGKWKGMFPGAVTAETLSEWNSQVRWPWGEKSGPNQTNPEIQEGPASESAWRDAASADHQTGTSSARWTVVSGLGASGCAMTVKPAALTSSWNETDPAAPTLEYVFESRGGDAAFVDFLPLFRIYPGIKLRIAVNWDDGAPVSVEVPGSGGAEDEVGRMRRLAVQQNLVRVRLPAPKLADGKHTLRIRAIDPGIVIDRVALP